ncbi:TetR/AcrR family transcriptional regulator [Celeribacter sp. ULVN23_4]
MARQANYDRDKVLKSAMELFWSKGFHATSLKDLEAALDMRPGSIYAAFGSKEGLFAEALKAYSGQTRSNFDAAFQSDGPILSRLADYIRSLGRQNRAEVPSRACMLVKTILEMPDDDPNLRGLAETLIDNMELELTKVFQAAQAAGEISKTLDPKALAARVQVDIIGLRAYAQRVNAGNRAAQIAEHIGQEIEALGNA